MACAATPTQTAVRIAARDFDFSYGGFQALSGVSLDIRANQVTALIGPSGCGNSTFLRLFNRMNDEIPGARVQGEVLLDGEDVNAANFDAVLARARVGTVFQRPNPFTKSIFDNVVYAPRVHREHNRARLEEIAEFSLRVADTTAFILSGELIEMGTTDTFITQPDDSRTEDYVRGRFG